MKKSATALAGLVMVTSFATGPVQASVPTSQGSVVASASPYKGCVSRKEFLKTRRKMTQHRIEKHIYGSHKNPVRGKVLKRTEHRTKIKYRGCNPDKWYGPKSVIVYRDNIKNTPDKKRRVWTAVGTYIPKLWV